MELKTQILTSAARAFFASAWADTQDEKDIDDETRVNLSGTEIMNVMPGAIDPAASHAARTLMFDVCRANHVETIDELYECAEATHIEAGRPGDRPFNADMFGHYLAMQAMGHGVGLRDAFGSEVYESIKVPYVEFGSHSLEKDY